MDTAAEVLFVIEIVLISIILTVIQVPLRKKEHRILRTVIFILKLVLIPATALLYESIEWKISYTNPDILCAVYVAIIGDVVASVFEYIIRRIRNCIDSRRVPRHRFNYKVGVAFSLMVCMVVLIAGTVNAETITKDTHCWQADSLECEHTFAFASDLHTGAALSMDALRDFCRQINESDAEFLILGGDITDELTSYEYMKETYNILSTVNVPVYMVYGNHDRQPGAYHVGGRTYSNEQLLDAISSAGITLLVDEYVQAADDLVILGREDISVGDARKDWSELVNPYGAGALIVVDHQPTDKKQLENEVSALQLSGHTHAGQVWPLKTIYNILGYPAYGEFSYPGTRLYVTPGTGGWALPLRTEVHSGWELITLHP